MVLMGLESSLRSGLTCKRKFRWGLFIDKAVGENNLYYDVLPPLKSARPNLQFKETMVHHLSEDMYYPGKPDWKPITITVYDVKRPIHPIFQWIEEYYRPKVNACLMEPNRGSFMKTGGNNVRLEMYDGCGYVLERWVFEDAWPQSIDFQTLDMADSGIMLIDITLRYARAWIEEPSGNCPITTNCASK